jgi:hypothetical protein
VTNPFSTIQILNSPYAIPSRHWELDESGQPIQRTLNERRGFLQPNDPDSYYQSRELVPPEMLADLKRAKIVITNYHAFKLRERLEIAKDTRNGRELIPECFTFVVRRANLPKARQVHALE